jgi:hypothetical protein
VPPSRSPFDLLGALSLGEIRAFLRRAHLLSLAGAIAVVYALASMLWGGMLALFPVHGGTTVELLTGSGTGVGWWNYPGLLVVAPWGVLALPFFPTLAMVVVAVGVGLGMAVASGLIARLLRPSPDEVARTKAVGVATGLTPAMISLVTLGSCCTTTAVATGGIGVIAQASGTSSADLLLNNWYLGAAQMAVVWAALFGQELLLRVYGGLYGPSDPPAPRAIAPPIDRRWAIGALLRAALVIGGVLWSLSMLAEWTTHDLAAAGPGWWFRWLVQHQVLAGFAIAAGFFPVGVAQFSRDLGRGPRRLLGGFLGVAALTVLLWLPPPLPAWGLDSFGSQLLGALGAPTAWGAIPLGSVAGPALAGRWALEYVVPAGFALAAVLAPEGAFAPLLATVARHDASQEVLASRPERALSGAARGAPRPSAAERISGTGQGDGP